MGNLELRTHGEKLLVNAFRVLTLGELDVVQKELDADILVVRLEENEMRFRRERLESKAALVFKLRGLKSAVDMEDKG